MREFQFKDIGDESKHMFEIIFSNVINDVLNDSSTQSILKRIDNQPVGLYAEYDGQEPANINTVSKGVDDAIMPQSSTNYSDPRALFLEDEFVDLVDLIMENTFFNIIQETTRKECDLLRVSKTFVTP